MNSKLKVKRPIAMQWKIAESRLQEVRDSPNDEWLDSDRFQIPGTNISYCLGIWPDGDNEEQRGKTWIFFYLYFKDVTEIETEITLSIDTANVSTNLTCVYQKFEYNFGTSICTVDELFDPEKHFIVDGELVVKLDGFVMIEMDAPVELLEIGDKGTQLGVELWNQDNKDFTIVAEKKEITAHKLILSTRSPVFAAMFKPHTQEAQENKVVIPDFSFDVVEAAVKLCYHHSLVKEVSLQDQMSLLQFFDKYDIQMLKDDLEQHLISKIEATNVCQLVNCSITSNASKLRIKCADFLQECIHGRKLVSDFDILDEGFAMDLLQNCFRPISHQL